MLGEAGGSKSPPSLFILIIIQSFDMLENYINCIYSYYSNMMLLL